MVSKIDKNDHIATSKLQTETRHWKTSLSAIEGELFFLEKLLSGDIFQEQTPNLFERLQEFKHVLNKIKSNKKNFDEDLIKHQRELEGLQECDTVSCDDVFYKRHSNLQDSFHDFRGEFDSSKMDIFNYVGGVLRRFKR